MVVLSVIFAIIGAIFLSISIFDPYVVHVDHHVMGIFGIILTMFAIIFAAITGQGSEVILPENGANAD